MLTVVVKKQENRATCYTPGCVNEVAWSEMKKKWTQLCMHHLSLHRDRCAKSNYKKKICLAQKNKASESLQRRYDDLRKKYEKLIKKYSVLKQSVGETSNKKKRN
jgi:hypothetical protein